MALINNNVIFKYHKSSYIKNPKVRVFLINIQILSKNILKNFYKSLSIFFEIFLIKLKIIKKLEGFNIRGTTLNKLN